MTPVKTIAISALLGTLAFQGAAAADAVGYVTDDAPQPLALYDAAEFDWDRFYVGIGGAGQDLAGVGEYGAGGVVGINMQHDYFLFGAEAGLLGLTDGTTGHWYGQVLGRGGLVITDEMVAYGAAGFGVDFGASGDQHVLLGGGLEYAITDAVSVKAQYLHGFAANAGATDTNQITFGINYHF